MANTYLSRTQGSGNRQIFTQSFWCKIADPSGTQTLAGTFDDSNNYNYCYLDGGNLKLQWKASGSVTATLDTNRKFRDTNAWYHIVYAVDTTQSTSSDRIKLYVNGVQETSFSTATYPTLNRYTEVNGNGITHRIGSIDGSQQYFNGIMSYVAHIDGTQELPTIFGETDATTGEWKIKTTITPSVGWGTNGFLILKDGNSLTDQSSNSNNFTLGGGTLTNTLDNPSNNFCTMSPIMQPKNSSMDVFKYGNLFCGGSSSVSDYSACGSIGVNTGKWYWEIKIEDADNTRNLGIVRADKINISTTFGFYVGSAGNSTTTAFTAGLRGSDGVFINKAGGSQTNTDISTTFTTGDIMAIALDLTSSTKTIQFYKNGSASGSAQTLDNAFVDDFVLPACRLDGGQTVTFNFGNGYFGTTAITTNSGNGYAGAEGKSKFNYQPPTGHSALTTKGLNQ